VATLREQQKQMTRALLLESALSAFQEKGYAATTIDDIASGAGTTRQTFYHHFGSKADVVHEFIAVLDTTFVSADDPPLADVVASGRRDLARAWLDRKFTQWQAAKPYLEVAYQAAVQEQDVDDALEAWFEATTSAMHEGLTRAGRFEPAARRIRCTLAFGQFEYLARRWMRVGWKVPRGVSLEQLTDSWCHLLCDAGGAR
jgi:AcrR family transcriptional regulator